MPATPRWLLAIPDAIRQLEALDRDLLTRRDLEQLFGVSRARAATLMQTFGAGSPATSERSREHNSSASSGNTGRGPPSAAKQTAASGS